MTHFHIKGRLQDIVHILVKHNVCMNGYHAYSKHTPFIIFNELWPVCMHRAPYKPNAGLIYNITSNLEKVVRCIFNIYIHAYSF